MPVVVGVNPARGAASVPACPCGCGLSRWPRRRGLPGLVAPGPVWPGSDAPE
nr:MAG TPA: hypothetical protein [Caudoviricetes sp.]